MQRKTTCSAPKDARACQGRAAATRGEDQSHDDAPCHPLCCRTMDYFAADSLFSVLARSDVKLLGKVARALPAAVAR